MQPVQGGRPSGLEGGVVLVVRMNERGESGGRFSIVGNDVTSVGEGVSLVCLVEEDLGIIGSAFDVRFPGCHSHLAFVECCFPVVGKGLALLGHVCAGVYVRVTAAFLGLGDPMIG